MSLLSKVSITIFFSFFLVEVNSGFSVPLYDTSFTIRDQMLKDRHINKAGRLSLFFDKCSTEDSIMYQRVFFLEFPSRFGEFDSIYGNNDFPGWLHQRCEKHIKLFCRAHTEKEDNRTGKILKLGFNGIWGSDNAFVLRECLNELVVTSLNTVISELNKHPREEIFSFWKFYFDGPHPESYQKEYDELLIRIKKLDPVMSDILKASYKQLLSESDQHGH